MESKKQKELLDTYFEGKVTRTNIKKLIQELNTPDFGKEFLEDTWENAESTMNPFVKERIFDCILEEVKPEKRINFRKVFQYAAVIIALLSTSLLVIQLAGNRNQSDMTFAVDKGQKATMTLSDGSKVWLNSGTELKYGKNFNEHERIIELNGEAYFEVAHNKKAPFIVKCHGLSVKALGTAFNIKAYEADELIQTSLVNGKVEISDQLNRTTLTPNQSLIYNRLSHRMNKENSEDCLQFAEWRNNKIFFNSQTFSEIAETLERNYNVKFIFKSETLKKYKYTGTVANTSINSMLQLFSMTSPLQYEMKGDTIYLNENKTTKAIFDEMISQ